jgi:hypothetical protein
VQSSREKELLPHLTHEFDPPMLLAIMNGWIFQLIDLSKNLNA